MNRIAIIIIIAFLGLMTIFLFSVFKIGEVPDMSWKTDYSINSKEPYGLWVMKSLLETRYGERNVSVDYNLSYYELDQDSSILYIAIRDRLIYDYYESSELEYLASMGNDVLLVANDIQFSGDYINIRTNNFPGFEDSLKIGYPGEKYPTSTYVHRRNSFEHSAPYLLRTFNVEINNDSTLTKETILWSDVTDPISFQIKVDTGRIMAHSAPDLFTNVASLQDFYVDHFNHIFNNDQIKKVIFSLPGGMDAATQSPLSILLKHRGLAYGYYMLLLTLLTLLYFGSKRIINPVKIVTPLKNNSMQYVETMTRLYEVHGDNVAVAKILESNFYDKVHNHYGLLRTEENFDEKLAKRLKVEPGKIAALRNQFNSIKAKFTDRELSKLRNSISNLLKTKEYG